MKEFKKRRHILGFGLALALVLTGCELPKGQTKATETPSATPAPSVAQSMLPPASPSPVLSPSPAAMQPSPSATTVMGRITAIDTGTVFDEAGHGWQPGSSYAIEEDGTAWIWGYQGMAEDVDHPRQLRLERPIRQISGFSLLTDDGIVHQINPTGTMVIDGLTDIIAIDEPLSGYPLLYALKADGTVWYRNRDAGHWNRLGEYKDIKALYSTAFSLFVQKSSGELIYIEEGGQPVPAEGVRVPLLRKAVQVEPGSNDDVLILDEAGEVFLVSASDMEVKPIKPAMGAKRIAYAGVDRYLFVKQDGTVWGVGQNRDGFLGEGADQVEQPVQIPVLSGIVDVKLGTDHGMALNEKGEVYTWGSNMTGQLGRLDQVYDQWTGMGELSDVRRTIPLINRPYFIRGDDSLWGMATDRSLFEIVEAKGTTELVTVNGMPVTLNKEGEVRLWRKEFDGSEPLPLPYPVKTLAADESKLIVLGTNGTLEVLNFSGKDGGTVYNSKVTANKLAGREKVSIEKGVADKIVSLHATPYTFLARTEDGQMLYTAPQPDKGYLFKPIAGLPPIVTVAAEYFIRHAAEPLTVWALDKEGTVHEIELELGYSNGIFQAANAQVTPAKEENIAAISGKMRNAADGTTHELGQTAALKPPSPLRLMSSLNRYGIEGPGNQYTVAVGEDNQIYLLGDNPFGQSDSMPERLNPV